MGGRPCRHHAIGFTDVEQALSWLDCTVREAWAGRIDRCDRLVLSANNLLAWLVVDNRRVIAKCCVEQQRFQRLAHVDALVSWLHTEGLPVAAPISAGDGRVRVERGRFSVGLYPLIDGNLLDATDAGPVHAAGRMLALLHQKLAVYPRLLDGQASPGRQLVHGDFRSANILCDGPRVAAVLDFDEMTFRSKSADLARAAVLLGTRYHDWAPTTLANRDVFLAGYGEVSTLTRAEQDRLQGSIAAVLNHFGWA